MRAVRYSEHGDTKVLSVVKDAPQPLSPAGPNTLIIKVAGAALNPVDFKMRRNVQPDLMIPKPKIPGYDISGTVANAGSGMHGFKIGDHVYGMLPIVGSPWGGLAEYAVADASVFAHAPTSIPLVDAAALPLVSLTVMQVFDAAGLVPPSDVNTEAPRRALVQAASGGVGTFAVQYLRRVLKFEEVLGTTSAPNADLVTSLGATRTIDYRTERFEGDHAPSPTLDSLGGFAHVSHVRPLVCCSRRGVRRRR